MTWLGAYDQAAIRLCQGAISGAEEEYRAAEDAVRPGQFVDGATPASGLARMSAPERLQRSGCGPPNCLKNPTEQGRLLCKSSHDETRSVTTALIGAVAQVLQTAPSALIVCMQR